MVVIGIVLYQWLTWNNAWKTFAINTGLEFESYKSSYAVFLQWPRICGTYRGNHLKIEKFAKWFGRKRKGGTG